MWRAAGASVWIEVVELEAPACGLRTSDLEPVEPVEPVYGSQPRDDVRGGSGGAAGPHPTSE